ncbi:lipocalin family protein [uncultured Tenacibaculum sp.]|uniref:lipocalin family protein n=1 Tax=uncultured Tenacibaculum sp. TaxID=174713 RepID=UPI00260EBA79|nr:lipocalin family protein [uncultured Tenacibaculum sp.]
MKPLLLIVLAITVFTSCSSDDEIDTNSITGTWKLISHSDLISLPECMKKSTLIFNSNNTISGTHYEADCDMNSISGSFSEINDSEYKIEFTGATDKANAIVSGNTLTVNHISQSSSQQIIRVLKYSK